MYADVIVENKLRTARLFLLVNGIAPKETFQFLYS